MNQFVFFPQGKCQYWLHLLCCLGGPMASPRHYLFNALVWGFNLQCISRVTLYTAGHLHTAVPHCSHSRAPIVLTAVPRENNEHGCVYLRCRAVCKLPGCVEGHPWYRGYPAKRALSAMRKHDGEGILPKGPYLPCVSMTGRVSCQKGPICHA